MKSAIYSDPVEQKIGRKSFTLDRKFVESTSNLLTSQFLTREHPVGGSIDMHDEVELNDYASVEDALRHTEMSAGMVRSLRRQARRTPSSSPPPLPPSSNDTGSIAAVGDTIASSGDGGEMDLYASVDTSSKLSAISPVKSKKGYDHLVAGDTLYPYGYDKLNPPERPPRTDLSPSHGSISSSGGGYDPLVNVSTVDKRNVNTLSIPSSEEYATIGGDGEIGEGNGDLPAYASINKDRAMGQFRPASQPHQLSHSVVTGLVPVQLFHTAQVGDSICTSTNSTGSTLRPRKSSQPLLDDLYSVPNNPRHGGRSSVLHLGGHHRMRSEDHILHDTTGQRLSVSTPRRSITPDMALYSTPDKTLAKQFPSPPLVRHNPKARHGELSCSELV